MVVSVCAPGVHAAAVRRRTVSGLQSRGQASVRCVPSRCAHCACCSRVIGGCRRPWIVLVQRCAPPFVSHMYACLRWMPGRWSNSGSSSCSNCRAGRFGSGGSPSSTCSGPCSAGATLSVCSPSSHVCVPVTACFSVLSSLPAKAMGRSPSLCRSALIILLASSLTAALSLSAKAIVLPFSRSSRVSHSHPARAHSYAVSECANRLFLPGGLSVCE